MLQTLHPNSRRKCPVCGANLPPMELIEHLFAVHPAEQWQVTLIFVSPAGAPDDSDNK